MNFHRLSRGFRAMTGALALMLVVAAAPAQTADLTPEVKSQVLERVADLVHKRAYVPGVDFNQWDKYIADVKPKLDAAKTDEEFQAGVNEALSKFGTSHIVLYTPRQADSRASGSTVGVGITTQVTEDGLLVVRTVKDAPAQRGGIVPGDIITLVDGNKVEGIKGIPGKEGTDVKLTVKHANGKTEDYVLTRRAFSTVRPEELTWPSKDTAKLNIYSFDTNSYSPGHVEELMQQASKAKNLIIDLRDNPGGAVVYMEHLLGMFIPDDKPIGTFVSRKLVNDYVDETKGDPKDLAKLAEWSKTKVRPTKNSKVPVYTGNLIVLVNAFSGSAAEIASAALRDDANATVIGTKSAGAVLVSIIVPATNDYMLQYPLSDYVTVKGLRLEGNGVVPDVPVTEPKYRLPNTPDDAVTKALAVFASGGKVTKTSTPPQK